MSPHTNAFFPPSDEEHSTDFMFDDDSGSFSTIPILCAFKTLQKPYSSKPVYDFGLSSSSSKHVDEEIQIDDKFQETQGGEIETNPP